MSSQKVTIRPARSQDLSKLGQPDMGKTFNAYTMELDGEIIGMAGVLHTERYQAFSVLTEQAHKYPVMIMKLAKKAVKIFNSYDVPLYAIASQQYERSSNLLIHLGFELIEETEYGGFYQYVRR